MDPTPKAQAAKEKNKLGIFKIKSVWTLKNKKMKRQSTKWEKIFLDNITDETYNRKYKDKQKKIFPYCLAPIYMIEWKCSEQENTAHNEGSSGTPI